VINLTVHAADGLYLRNDSIQKLLFNSTRRALLRVWEPSHKGGDHAHLVAIRKCRAMCCQASSNIVGFSYVEAGPPVRGLQLHATAGLSSSWNRKRTKPFDAKNYQQDVSNSPHLLNALPRNKLGYEPVKLKDSQRQLVVR
jgi:hypothetical protein